MFNVILINIFRFLFDKIVIATNKKKLYKLSKLVKQSLGAVIITT